MANKSILYRAKTLFGIFEPVFDISDENGSIIYKSDSLYFASKTEHVRLTPLSDSSQMIVDMFDIDPVNNSNLLEWKINSDRNVEITFHKFSNPVKKLITPEDGKLNFYVEPGLADEYCSKNGTDENGLLRSIIDDCVISNSIFIAFGKQTFSTLTIIGNENGYRASEERPGLFRISKITPVPKRIPEFEIIQVYGGFSFLTWQDSFNVASNSITQINSARIPDMLIAWDNYVKYLEKEAKDQQAKNGLHRYLMIDTSSGYVDVHFSEDFDIGNCPLFSGDLELELTSSEIEEPTERAEHRLFLGKIVSIDIDNSKVTFQIPRLSEAQKYESIVNDGYIRVSSFSAEQEAGRRKQAYAALKDQTNIVAKNINRLLDPDIKDSAALLTHKPVTGKVLTTMFGENFILNGGHLTETYLSAMDIALNTPDVAIIQGPPGTGKTTLIRGIMARINEVDPNAKILLTAEQHDALDNAVRGVKSTMPPVVTSHRHDTSEEEEVERLEKTIQEFKKSLIESCDKILEKTGVGELRMNLEKIVFITQKIRHSSFDKNVIASVLPDLKKEIMDMDNYVLLDKELQTLNNYSSHKENKAIYQDPLLKLINAQRTSRSGWSDDGYSKLKELVMNLECDGHDNLLPDEKLVNELKAEPTDTTFSKFNDYVFDLKRSLFPEIGMSEEEKLSSVKDALSKIAAVTDEAYKDRFMSLEDIVYEFKNQILENDNILQIVRNYSSVVATTCAQAKKATRYSSISSSHAKYVVVDEAARVNPLELINAILMGTKIILVGDQFQLPQYLEAQAVAKYVENGGSVSKEYSKLLSLSLFGALYDNLDRAYKEGRIKAKRTIMLSEQYRMHPAIGDFISEEFYSGGIKSAELTSKKINDFGVCNGSNVAFVDLPMDSGREVTLNKSYVREVEINKTLSLMSELFSKNPTRELNIGILSFYKGQIEIIKEKAKERFSSEQLSNVEFGTVDSFQGKEFDIVIISCVRSNGADRPINAVGFLCNAPNRINVALSRARKLLVLIGDSETLTNSESLRHYIAYVKEKGYYER